MPDKVNGLTKYLATLTSHEPILDPSVNDLTKTTTVVNQGIHSVSYTKGNTKVTKYPDVANTLNLDNIIKDSGRTIPNE